MFDQNHDILKAKAGQLNVLIGMYAALPEPPTLNAILVLSKWFKSVVMLRNNLDFPAESYPHTPVLKEIGEKVALRDSLKVGTLGQLRRFGKYCLALRKELQSGQYKLIIFHDYHALLAYWLVKKWGGAGYRGVVWFNSYDVIDLKANPVGRFSLVNLIIRNHAQIFSGLDFFSLPAVERTSYYPVQQVKKETFVIPNFPAIHFYQPFYQPKNLAGQRVFKMIYQGALGKGHGYENIIRILDKKVGGMNLQLILKGWIVPEYKAELIQLAEETGVANRLSFEGFSLYRSVPQLAATCQAGLAIFTRQDVMNQTLGTASNKIYEYIALGLPVVLFDTPHFRHYLDKQPWAFFTDLSEHSLIEMLENVVNYYETVTLAAHQSFMQDFNFEKVFTPALCKVLEAVEINN